MSDLRCRLHYPLPNFAIDLELIVPPGVAVLLGPNGTGKSSVLRLLAGLTQPASGLIELAGHVLFDSTRKLTLPPEKRRIGMVFQDLALFPHLNVQENIGFGLKMNGVKLATRGEKIDRLLKKLAIGHLANRQVRVLSGGEKQKVALARTLAVGPQLLLLDEPTAALDPTARNEIRHWLRNILTELQTPTLLVTHDIEDVAFFRKRIAVMEDGRIVQQGSFHQLLKEPATEFVARFVGVNYIPGQVQEMDGKTVFISSGGTRFIAPFESVCHGPGCLTVYPWDIALYHQLPEGSPRNHLHGNILDVVILGDRVRITMEEQDKLVAELSYRGYQALGEPQAGDRIWAVFKAREARIENFQE